MEKIGFKTPSYIFKEEETKLQMVFPVEIWLLILNQIMDLDHYESLCAASFYFHKLLLPHRSRFLFPKIIKLCIPYMFLSKQAFSSLFKCRGVCKDWKQGVDLMFDHILSQTTPDPTDWKSYSNRTCILNPNQSVIMNRFFNARKIQNFVETFHVSHFLIGSNPFPTRCVHLPIRMLSTNPYYEYNFKILDVFRRYGHHIWHCSVTLWCQNADDLKRALVFLRPLVNLLPELKTLRIHHSTYHEDMSTKFLLNILRANPLPKLETLQLLEERNLPKAIFSHLIQTNPQITKLKLDKLDSNKHRALFKTPLPDLVELQILYFKSAKDFLYFQNVQVQWPLKKLTMFCHIDTPHVKNVFRLIETKWAETLTDLSLIIPSSVSFSNACSLKLPHLQSLKIKVEQYVCMDFIMPLSKSLVNLNVYHEGKCMCDDNLEQNCKIKFFLHRRNLLESNIWKYLPRLRELNYADDKVRGLSNGRLYRRNYWEKYSSVELIMYLFHSHVFVYFCELFIQYLHKHHLHEKNFRICVKC